MNDHSYYEELVALSAAGELSESELAELREHLAKCVDCQQTERAFRDLTCTALPLVRTDFSFFLDRLKFRSQPGARTRFLARARHEGIRFSSDVERQTSVWSPKLAYAAGSAFLLAVVIMLALFYEPSIFRQKYKAQSQQQIERLTRENAMLSGHLAQREHEVNSQQEQIHGLQSQVANLTQSTAAYRRENEQTGIKLGQSTSQTAQLAEELQNREKRLAQASDELARINELRASDQASLVAQQIRINEISDQLRIASATLDMERQLTAAGRDIRELMVARQLHVVDVRDTDANGKPRPSFARIFLTEGKSLMFYAFDLNEGRPINAKARFQVWGEQLAKNHSVHSLGLLYVDDNAQKRWALKVEDPTLLNEINSVFVTVAAPGAGDKPSGQRLLYAYLGEPNHP